MSACIDGSSSFRTGDHLHRGTTSPACRLCWLCELFSTPSPPTCPPRPRAAAVLTRLTQKDRVEPEELMQDFDRPVASSVMPRAARGPSLRRGQGILPHRRWVGAPAAVSWSVLPPGVGTIHEWWHCGLANTPSRRTAESPMCRWACCRARCHSHRPVSQSGRTGVGCARRQHFTNLATLTSPISAYTVVFATNGSGGGDAKAAAGTAMREHVLVTCRGHNALLLSARAAGSSLLLPVSFDEASSSSKVLLRTGF